MRHFHSPRSVFDAERRLNIATEENRAAQADAARAAERLVADGEAYRAELEQVTAGTEDRLKQQAARRAARRNGSIETAIEALKVFGSPH